VGWQVWPTKQMGMVQNLPQDGPSAHWHGLTLINGALVQAGHGHRRGPVRSGKEGGRGEWV
jgi:hypothetical protein